MGNGLDWARVGRMDFKVAMPWSVECRVHILAISFIVEGALPFVICS